MLILCQEIRLNLVRMQVNSVAMSLTAIIFVAREHNFEALIFLVAKSVLVGILQAIFEKPCLFCQGFYSCYIFYSIVAIYSIHAPR